MAGRQPNGFIPMRFYGLEKQVDVVLPLVPLFASRKLFHKRWMSLRSVACNTHVDLLVCPKLLVAKIVCYGSGARQSAETAVRAKTVQKPFSVSS